MQYETEIVKEPGGWTLIVNGVRCVQRESRVVCENVEFAVNHPEQAPLSESLEVAWSIRRWFEAQEGERV